MRTTPPSMAPCIWQKRNNTKVTRSNCSQTETKLPITQCMAQPHGELSTGAAKENKLHWGSPSMDADCENKVVGQPETKSPHFSAKEEDDATVGDNTISSQHPADRKTRQAQLCSQRFPTAALIKDLRLMLMEKFESPRLSSTYRENEPCLWALFRQVRKS